MLNQSTEKFNSTDFYGQIYQIQFCKISGIFLSLINIFVLTPLLYSIIWYERYGTNQHRTLINQLVAYSCWHSISYNLVGQTAEIALSIFGPFSPWFCHWQLILKNVVNLQQIQLLLSMIGVKYLSIFVLKNPAALDHQFWSFFITISTLSGKQAGFWLKQVAKHLILRGLI